MAAPIALSDVAIHIPPGDERLQQNAVTDLIHGNNIRFPGAQPVSFARKHLKELQETDYFMCEKTDGIRCLLYLTEISMGPEGMVEAQFLIDRKNDYYYVGRDLLHIPAPAGLASHHTGTLLDGELVRQQWRDKDGRKTERLAYLIFDLLAIDGENVTQKPFDKRLARIQERIVAPIKQFAKQYPEDIKAQPFQLEMKNMEFPYAVEMMFREKIPKLPHGNDGLIFTCKGTNYVFGTDEKILKWKPPLENTIDFRLMVGAFPVLEDEEGTYEDWDAIPEMELYVNHGGRGGGYQPYAHLTVTNAEWASLKALDTIIDGRIIECYRDPKSSDEKDIWRMKLDNGVPRFRDDKTDANHISVVASVEDSIRDPVTKEDLISIAGEVRKQFKARAESAKREHAEEMRIEEERRRAEIAGRAKKVEDEDEGPGYED